MDNSEIDPWAQIGNMNTNSNGEVSQESLERAAEWENSMSNAPEFAGDQFSDYQNTDSEMGAEQANNDSETFNKSISDASAIINYGLNAAARETSVDSVIQTINNFVPNYQESPVQQLLSELGIDTKKEVDDLNNEKEASKTEENDFISNDINANFTTNKSIEGELQAIQDVKELVSEVQASPIYSQLRSEASSAGKGVFEYAVSKYPVRDLVTLFKTLSEQKAEDLSEKLENPEEPKQPEENAVEDSTIPNNQTENQSSTEKSSPETDATERKIPPKPLYL